MGQEEGGCVPGGEGGKSLLERFWKPSEAPVALGRRPGASSSSLREGHNGGRWQPVGRGWQGWLHPEALGWLAVSLGRSWRHQGAEAKAWGPFCPIATTLRSCRLPWVPTVLDTHMPPMVTVAQVRSEKAGTVSVAPLAGRM